MNDNLPPPPMYDIDDDTRALMEGVLAMAQRTVDTQYDQETADELQDILVDMADRFGIEMHAMDLVENEDGVITLTPIKLEEEAEPEKPRWTPKVIENDDPRPRRQERSGRDFFGTGFYYNHRQ